jgi:hypothetical protein
MSEYNKKNSSCLGLILPFLNRFSNSPDANEQPEPLPYRVRDDFLSPAEFSFYKILTSIVGIHITIQSKVRLSDIFFVAQPNKNFAYISKINQRHLDFLGCDPTTMRPLFGIELDDSSHERSERQKRDAFLNDIFQAADLPLLRIPVQREYNTQEIRTLLKQFLRENVHISATPVQTQASVQDISIPLCPKCGIPMILRTVAKGEHIGKQFFGCRNYPQCREVKPLPVQNKQT